MKILMISRSVYMADVRVRREAEALADAGHRVVVVGLGGDEPQQSGVEVIGIGHVEGLKPNRSERSGPLYRAARWALLPNHRAAATRQFADSVRRRLRSAEIAPDVVHAHDFPALSIGAEIADSAGARLVYDSHEIWGDMARHGRPDPLGRQIMLRRERELARRADRVITISEGAAQVLSDRFRLSEVLVVRNTFPVRSDLELPETPTGAVYSGRIAEGRDLRTLFTAWERLDGLDLHLIGSTDGTLKVPARATLHASSDLDTVERLLTRVGVGLVPLASGPLNHDVALPNKLFEAISVGVPVVAADLPELSKLVRDLDLGVVYEPGNPNSLVTAMREVVERYDDVAMSVRTAAPAFDWAIDAGTLLSAYEFGGGKHGTATGAN